MNPSDSPSVPDAAVDVAPGPTAAEPVPSKADGPVPQVHPRWLVLGLAVVIIFTDAVGYTLIIPALPTFVAELGLGETRAGMLYASYGLISLLLYLPFGMLVDRVGERRLLILGMVVLGLASLGFWRATDFWSLLGCRVTQGVAASATWAAALPLAARLSSRKRRGVEMSVLMMGFSVGVVAGPALGSVGGTRDPFLYFAGLPLLLAVCAAVLLPGRVAAASSVSAPRVALFGLRPLPPALVCACLVLMLICAVLGAIEILLPLEFHRLGWSRGQIGLFFSGWGLAMLVVQPLIGWWSDRRGRREPLRIGLLVATVCVPALFSAIETAWLFPLTLATIVAGAACLVPTLPLMADALADDMADGQSGLAFGFYNMAFSLGMTFGPWTGGYLAEMVGPLWAVGLLAVPLLVMALVLPSVLRAQAGAVPATA